MRLTYNLTVYYLCDTDDMSQGRREAFEVFRVDYPHNSNIEENKRTLKQR